MLKCKNLSFATKISLFSTINIILISVVLVSSSYFFQSRILLDNLKNQSSQITESWSKELKVDDVAKAKEAKDYNDPAQKKLTEYFDLLSKYNPNVAQGYIYGTELQDGNKTSVIAFPSHVIKAFKDAGLKVGDMYEQPKEIARSIQTMKDTQSVTFSNIYNDDYGTWITIIYPIKDKNGQISSYFGVDIDASMVASGQKKLIINSGIAVLIFLILAILIQSTIVKRALSPIRDLVQGIDKVSEGNLDVELKTGTDELGHMSAKFNIMVCQIKEMILKIKETSHDIEQFSKSLLSVTEKNTEHAAKINEDIKEMALGIETQEHSTVESANTINIIATGVQSIANNAFKVSSSAADMENKSQKGNNAIEKVVDQMQSIADAVKDSSSVIKVLHDRSKEISNIMNIITNISSQTNLLALNAAIEAARAGEQGKGFAVVADEVRKLAEQTQKSAEQIVELIQVIENEIANAVNSMSKGSGEVEVGMEMVKETGDLFLDILDTTKEVTEQIQDVSGFSQQISATTEEITATVTDLISIAKQTSSTSCNISDNVALQQDSMESVVHASKKLSVMSEELQKLISKFQV